MALTVQIRKRYGDFTLDVDFSAGNGEALALLGASGSGKSTALRCIAGICRPDWGRIELDGEILFDSRRGIDLPPQRRKIGYLFQQYALFPHMTVEQNIAVCLDRRQRAQAGELMVLLRLEGTEKLLPRQLSGGQQQRIAIARAIVNEPQILLLDEPLGALDLKMRKEMQLELKSMHDKLGITFIYVTHDQEEALTMSDKIVVMSEGRIQQVGEPEDIYNEPKNAFVADFIGESNIFNGIMTGKYRVRFCGAEFICVDDVENGTMIDAVLRPEDIQITPP